MADYYISYKQMVDGVVASYKDAEGREIVGDLSELTTSNTDSIVDSINSIITERGSLNNLTTTDNDSIVNAINEINLHVDNLKICNVLDNGATGDGVTDDTDAIQDCVDNYDVIYFPSGTYIISEPVIVPNSKHLYGSGRESILKAAEDFTSIVKVANTPAENTNVTLNSVIGLFIADWQNNGAHVENLQIDGNGIAEGVYIYNHASNTLLRKLFITNCTYGIRNMRNGWGHVYSECYITRCITASIELAYAANGCTITDCQLYGQDISTAIHLWVHNQCYGNVMKGGFIEGCARGVFVAADAQISLYGLDVEACSDGFFWSWGDHDDTTGLPIDVMNPPCVISGCNFVNTSAIPLTNSGIIASGGNITIIGCMFISTDVDSSAITLFRLDGTVADKNTISSISNVFRDWSAVYPSRCISYIPYIQSNPGIIVYDSTLDKYVNLTVDNGVVSITDI